MLNDEIHYRIFKAIEESPSMSQRELAAHLGVSLGKANYCLKELINKGLVEVGSLKSSTDKRDIAYLLTPSGAEEKARVIKRFLHGKMDAYQEIKKEIEHLLHEIDQAKLSPDTQDS